MDLFRSFLSHGRDAQNWRKNDPQLHGRVLPVGFVAWWVKGEGQKKGRFMCQMFLFITKF